MNAYLIELLFPTGWRRMGELQWRVGDAIATGEHAIADGARGYRVLAVTVQPAAVVEHLVPAEAGNV
jgi:hypothetical protein